MHITDKIFTYIAGNKISAISVNVCELIPSYQYSRNGSKFLVKQFSSFNIAHLSKFVVNFYFIIVQTQMPCYFNGSFCSVMARGTSHFYSFFPSIVLAEVNFWYDNYGLWPWQAKPRIKNQVIQFFSDSDKLRMPFFLLINAKCQ